MADNKIVYDVDFNVHTEKIDQQLDKSYNAALVRIRNKYLTDLDAVVSSLGERLGTRSTFLKRVGANLGFADPNNPQYQYFADNGVTDVVSWAKFATSPEIGYTPASAQGMINNAVAAALKKSKKRPDKQFQFEMENLTNEIREAQTLDRRSALASELLGEASTFIGAAQAAQTPEARKALFARAAGRYGSITARTLMESGAVDPATAALAMGAATDASTLASNILTGNQVNTYNKTIWRNSPNVLEPKAEAAFAATKASQEDLAWASRGYDEKQKAREMEMGFRAMEASSATEEVYNTNEGPATEHGITNAIAAAGRYVRKAADFEEGSAQRRAMLTLASSAISGITPGGMSKAGMTADKIADNTLALTNLTAEIKALSGSGPSGEGGAGFWGKMLTPTLMAGIVTGGLSIADDIMQGRTRWLADTKTPYDTRREVRQGWAMNYGKKAAFGGAGLGATVGFAVGGPIGALGGAVIGAVPGAISWLAGRHYNDEKKLGDAYQARAISMNSHYALYGDRVDYNYAQLAGGTGYVSQEAVLGVTQAADYLPGAMAFGAVNEQQMMALSYMPNYYRAILDGAGTADLLAAYKNDIENIPPMYRQYISSLLPGINEEIRGFVSTSAYDQIASVRGELKGYDWQQRAAIPALERTKVELSRRDVADVNKNMMNEIPKLNSPNLLGALDNSWNTADVGLLRGVPYGSMAAPGSGSMRMTDLTEAILSAVQKGPYDKEKTLGDLIINIDGVNVVHEELKPSDFIHQTQTYMVGGA